MQRMLFIALGVILGVLALEGALFLLAERARLVPSGLSDEYTILAIGESTTQGAAGFAYETTYTHQLEKILNSRCLGLPVRVVNRGLAGTNSPAIFAALPAWLAELRPSLVISMMGINDYQLGHGKEVQLENAGPRTLKLLRWLAVIARERLGWIFFPREIYFRDDPRTILEKMAKYKIELTGAAYHLHFAQPLENEGGSMEDILSAHRKVLTMFPGHSQALVAAGNYERALGRLQEAEKLHRLALQTAPDLDRDWIRYSLAVDLAEAKKWKEVDELLPEAPDAFYSFLYASLFIKEGQMARAEELLKRARKLHPHDGRLSYLLAEIYAARRDYLAMRKERGVGDALFAAESSAVTSYYYQEIARLLHERGVSLLAMQYPMRTLEPLRKSLVGFHDRVFFLSNLEPFVAALKSAPYEKIFYDRFGGNFGHMTTEGNRILAENIFAFLRKEVAPFRDRCQGGR